jgi:hypothetical protein
MKITLMLQCGFTILRIIMMCARQGDQGRQTNLLTINLQPATFNLPPSTCSHEPGQTRPEPFTKMERVTIPLPTEPTSHPSHTLRPNPLDSSRSQHWSAAPDHPSSISLAPDAHTYTKPMIPAPSHTGPSPSLLLPVALFFVSPS